MVWVSFFKPVGIFDGAFNRLAAWWTSGDYCHCELVFHVPPPELMSSVYKVYDGAGEKLCAHLEQVFFGDKMKQLIQEKSNIYVSFSLLWGHDAEVRILQSSEYPWYSTPDESYDDLVWVECHGIREEKRNASLLWALGEMTKPYNSSAAMCSWMPSWEVNSVDPRDSYFCSEFVSMNLVRMGHLTPLCTHHCTPNDLIDILERTPQYSYASSSSDEEAELHNLMADIEEET